MEKQPSILEIERALGLDSVKPIRITPSDEADFLEKADDFRDWYESELKELYHGSEDSST